MFKTFERNFAVKNTYRVNSIIYFIRNFPLFKKVLKDSLYKNKAIKMISLVISYLIELFFIFIGKVIYLFVIFSVLGLISDYSSVFPSENFIVLVFFGALIGSQINSHSLDPSQHNYYSIILLRMNAKKVALSQLIYYCLKVFIGFGTLLPLFGLIFRIDINMTILLVLYIVLLKISAFALKLKLLKINNNKLSTLTTILLSILFASCAFIFIYFGINISIFALIFMVITIAVIAVFSLNYIIKFKDYLKIYKRNFFQSPVLLGDKNSSAKVTVDYYTKKIDVKEKIDNSKKGYNYLNDVFMKRHRLLLSKPVKIIAVVEIIAVLAVFIGLLISPEVKALIISIPNSLSSFLFLYYILNRGQKICSAMFINCDNVMLKYRFYREPTAILKLFSLRIKTLLKLELTHSVILAVGIPFLIFFAGGSLQLFEYVLIGISLLLMSVLFTVHNLTLYYLLQPYNELTQVKNPIYSLLSGLTYLPCYMLLGDQIPLIVFGTSISLFCIFYIALALLLVYKLAWKTFKIHS